MMEETRLTVPAALRNEIASQRKSVTQEIMLRLPKGLTIAYPFSLRRITCCDHDKVSGRGNLRGFFAD